MKKLVSLSFILFLGLFASQAFAQTTWTWKQHNLSFTLPSSYEAKTNTGEQFTASDGLTDFGIFVFKDASVTKDNIKDHTAEIAESIGLDKLDAAEELDFNGFEGGAISGWKDGNEVLVCGFIDPSSDVNFFVTIKLYGDVGEDEAIQIVKSIKKI